MLYFKIEYLSRRDGGIILDFRFVTARDLAGAEATAKSGLSEVFAADAYRVRDDTGQIVASSFVHA